MVSEEKGGDRMRQPLQRFLTTMNERGLDRPEAHLMEALRVWWTDRALQESPDSTMDTEEEPDRLFGVMKEQVEGKLGHFPGDRDLFFQWYHLLKDLDVIDSVTELVRADRSHTLLLPEMLFTTFADRIRDEAIPPRTLLITEAEKFLPRLKSFVESNRDRLITLTTERWIMHKLLELAFAGEAHVRIRFQSIYKPMDLPLYDGIFSVPDFGGRLDPAECHDQFWTNETEGIAAENLLRHLTEQGILHLIAPAKLTFGGAGLASLRRVLSKAFQVGRIEALPEGSLRPWTGIRAYWITLSKQPVSQVILGRLGWKDGNLSPETEQRLTPTRFADQKDWRVDLYLADNQAELARYQASDIRKTKLKEVAEIFRGKSIMKKDIRPGEIAVLNISNLEEGEVLWDGLDTIAEERRKVRRYELEPGDLVMTCRGTVNKFAVIDQLPRTVIASANIIVLRFKEGIDSTWAKIFLESPVGAALVKSFQRGGTVMNINPGDIGELEIPWPDPQKQQRLIEEYRREWEHLRETIRQAEERWKNKRTAIEQQLYQ